MNGQLQCYGGSVSNPATGGFQFPCYLYDDRNVLVCSVSSNEVKILQNFTATRMRIVLGNQSPYWVFPQPIQLHPGDMIIFSSTFGQKRITVTTVGQQPQTFWLTRGNFADPLADFAATSALVDPYLDQVFTLANLHALLGSTQDEFMKDLHAKNIHDDVELKRLDKDQFKQINEANATVRLEGNRNKDDDQQVYDETSMLATMVNARMQAIANAKHPDQYDITKPAERLAMINASANSLFNKYNSGMGNFITTKSLSSATVKRTYNSISVKLDAIRDIFQSLALPEAALSELLGAVTSFIESTKELSVSSENKSLHNAKLVNFYSIQPPLGNPTLQHIAKMRMFYVQFDEYTSTWTSNCASGRTYDLDVTVFTLDVEMNRSVVHLVYPHAKDLLIQAADADLDALGASGAPQATDKPVKVPGDNPIGPPPIPPP